MKIDYYSRYLKYKQKYIDLTGGADKCFLYLTLDDKDSFGRPWGGTHITLVGGGNTLEQLRNLRTTHQVTNFNSGSNVWTLNHGSNLRIQLSGGIPTLMFDSGTLDKLSLYLNSLLVNVKGPLGNNTKKSKWHISFPEDQLITKLKEFQHHVYWHLTICIERANAQGIKEYSWEKL
jgi:hypothetical protein